MPPASRALSIAWREVVPPDPTGPQGGSGTLPAEVITEQGWQGLAVTPGRQFLKRAHSSENTGEA